MMHCIKWHMLKHVANGEHRMYAGSDKAIKKHYVICPVFIT